MPGFDHRPHTVPVQQSSAMIKTLAVVCLCAFLVVQAQGPPPGSKPPPPPPQGRVARQAPGGMPQVGGVPPGMNAGGGPGNMGMQGLGNIPDPTVWIAKGQEMASQLAKGRRRRQLPDPAKIPDSFPKIPEPPMPKVLH